MSKLVVIQYCIECPHSERVSDPGSDDSFDAQDEALVCKVTAGVTLPDRTFDHRPIIRCERRWKSFKVPIPDWCPLEDAHKEKK